MALMRVAEYRELYFLRPPTPNTVRAWARNGDIYGERRGRVIYVDPDRDPTESKLAEEARQAISDPDVAALVERAGG